MVLLRPITVDNFCREKRVRSQQNQCNNFSNCFYQYFVEMQKKELKRKIVTFFIKQSLIAIIFNTEELHQRHLGHSVLRITPKNQFFVT